MSRHRSVISGVFPLSQTGGWQPRKKGLMMDQTRRRPCPAARPRRRWLLTRLPMSGCQRRARGRMGLSAGRADRGAAGRARRAGRSRCRPAVLLMAALVALLGADRVTGALHEDGLADTADGFWGGHGPRPRLDIMRDSRIGAYGVIALNLGAWRGGRAGAAFEAGPAERRRPYRGRRPCHAPRCRRDGRPAHARADRARARVGRPTAAATGALAPRSCWQGALAALLRRAITTAIRRSRWADRPTRAWAHVARAKIGGTDGRHSSALTRQQARGDCAGPDGRVAARSALRCNKKTAPRSARSAHS